MVFAQPQNSGKMNVMEFQPNSQTVTAWKQGVIAFNEGRYWDAHENWEWGWKTLPQPEKLYLQALIQACAAFYLFEVRGRYSAAFRLTESSLKKLNFCLSGEFESEQRFHIQISRLEETLRGILKINRSSQTLTKYPWKDLFRRLKATLDE
jgi:hypothetical protein